MADNKKDLILCHGSKIEFLENIIEGGKIPHAFLFTGAKGIGKSAVANIFAKMLLSIGSTPPKQEEEPDSMDLFGDVLPKVEVKTSRINPIVSDKVDNGNHLDLYLLNKPQDDDKKNIGIDEVRALGRFLSLTPGESIFRVALIDSIDDFNTNSANALLKILEEPTKNTILIIICHSKAGLLPTIKSRCHEINFKALNKEEFEKSFSKVGHENIEDIYELSDGSPGFALEIIDKKVNDTLDKYLNIIKKKIVNISEVTAIAKEIKDKGSWDIFGKLLLKNYSRKIINSGNDVNIDDLNKYSELNKIIYFSSIRNMDIQDSLKLITYQINNNN